MPGEVDPLYVAARRVLLDALEALKNQHAALILVGAQAIYLHTGEAKFSVPECTTDADIAGPAALMVAKLHKISERISSPDRLADKDALDAYRLLRAIETEPLVEALRRLLRDDRSRDVTKAAIDYLRDLFGTPEAQGCGMAARSVVPLENPDEITAALAALAGDLLSSL